MKTKIALLLMAVLTALMLVVAVAMNLSIFGLKAAGLALCAALCGAGICSAFYENEEIDLFGEADGKEKESDE